MEQPNNHEDTSLYTQFKSKFTMNKFGKMSLTESPHFKLVRKMMDKSRPVLETACAYGFTTKILLENGFKVIANDLDERHLAVLANSIEDKEKISRLTLKPGNILELNDFEPGSLSGVLALNLVHFFEASF